MTEDIRWQQRLANFNKALEQLDAAMTLDQERELTALEKQGVIQCFEYNYELGWQTLRDYLQWQGFTDLAGSRDTIREAYAKGLIRDGDGWMAMLAARNRTSHTYNLATANAILDSIRTSFHDLFRELAVEMAQRKRKGLHP